MTVLEYEGEKLDQAQLEGVQAMVDDLKRQYASLKVAMQDVCDKDGNLKTDSEGTFLRRITSRLYPTRHIGAAKLWDLLAPVDHQHNPVTYDAVAHSNGVWRVMAAVGPTFPPISVAPVDNDPTDFETSGRGNWTCWPRSSGANFRVTCNRYVQIYCTH